jgi:hypothetical protein
MSFSAGLLNVQTLNVPGGAGSIVAANLNFDDLTIDGSLNVPGATTLNTLSTSGATHIGGAFDVSGNAIVYGSTTLKTLSTGATQVNGSLDVSGNSGIKGNLTLGTNSVVRSDGSGNFVVQGNVLATGSVVTSYNPSYQVLDTSSNWEGIWSVVDIGGSGLYSGYIAIVKQPNNTYTAYTNSTGTATASGVGLTTNSQSQYFNQQFQILAINIIPTFTKDLSGNVTANSITLPTGFQNAGTYPGTNVFITRRLRTADIGSNVALYQTGTKVNNQSYLFAFMERILLPNQVTPVNGSDWFSAYQSIYNETRVRNFTHTDVFDDLEGTYNSMKQRMFTAYSLSKKAVDIITGQVYPINKFSPQPFIIENKFDEFKTATDDYSLPVNRIHFGVYGKPNVMTFHYDWRVQNVNSPLISPFQEISIVNTSSPSTPVIGTIPSSFKFLRSFLEKQSPKQNIRGIKEPSEWFMDNFVGLRLPLVVSGTKTLTITTTGPTSSFDIIPGVYTVTIPSGWVGYPHSLASYITQNLNSDSGLRLDFYTKNKNYTNLDLFDASTTQNFYYFSSGTNTIASVSVTCSDVTFLTDVLGLNTLSTAQNPNAAPIKLVVGNQSGYYQTFGNLQRGGFPTYTYNGNQLDTNNLYTPQALPVSTANLNVIFSLGNVLTSGNPRDYFNVMFYFCNIIGQEEHNYVKSILTLADIDEEHYMPDTWEEAVYKFVDLNAFAIYIDSGIQYSILNADSTGIFGGKSLQNHMWNYSTTTQPFGGLPAMRNLQISNTMLTLEKMLKPSYLSTLKNAQLGYIAANYLDSSNTFVIARRFTSTVTNLLSQNMSSYWMPLALGGGLPADVTAAAQARVPYSFLLNDSSNSVYGVASTYGHLFGLFKQSVANAILPPDASGSVCGYVFFGSFIFQSNVPFRDAIVSLFKSKGVKYCVTDVRGNPGGANSTNFVPYGLNNDFTYTYFTNMTGSREWGVSSQSINVATSQTIIADILDNSGNYPATWRYPIDASGYVIDSSGLGGVDNTTYKQTGNKFTIWRKIPQTIGGLNNTVDGSNNGQGLFSWCFLTDQNSFSASKGLVNALKGNLDDTDYTKSVGPKPPVTNTHYTLYGTHNRLGYENNDAPTGNWEYNDTINPGNGGSLDQDVFYENGYMVNAGARLDLSGNSFSSSFNQPGITYDALSNWTPLTMMTETGVYYDASGIQQAYTGGSYNAFRVSNDNLNSYRDFRVERALQCAYTQRAGCRAQPKFGYMPIDNGTTYSIVDASGINQVYDPYNYNITDTSGALPLPVNPFGLT